MTTHTIARTNIINDARGTINKLTYFDDLPVNEMKLNKINRR